MVPIGPVWYGTLDAISFVLSRLVWYGPDWFSTVLISFDMSLLVLFGPVLSSMVRIILVWLYLVPFGLD